MLILNVKCEFKLNVRLKFTKNVFLRINVERVYTIIIFFILKI